MSWREGEGRRDGWREEGREGGRLGDGVGGQEKREEGQIGHDKLETSLGGRRREDRERKRRRGKEEWEME